MFDIEKLKSDNPISTVIGARIKLKKQGQRDEGCCPFHADKTASFCVYPAEAKFYCYGCGEYGDVIDFIEKYEGVDFKSAIEILGGERALPNGKTRVSRSKKISTSVYDGITPIMPVPFDASLISANVRTPKIWNPNRNSFTAYTPTMVFEYRSVEGALLGYVLRIDLGEGRKITPSIMWCQKDGEKDGEPELYGWCHFSFPEPRPLYGLERLNYNTDAPVLIVEGEKTADAAHKILPAYTTVTWSGGVNAVGKADFRPLQGFSVLIWPDADKPGVDASIAVADKCKEIGAKQVRLIAWDKTKEKGWDAADALAEKWTKQQVVDWAKERVSVWPPPELNHDEKTKDEPDDIPPVSAYDGEVVSNAEIQTHQDPNPLINMPFKALGYNDNIYYYLPDATQQILALTIAQHTKPYLICLAPIRYWEGAFPGNNKGIDWDGAAEAVQIYARKFGFFDGHTKIRGRGAWLDAGRSILHLGSKVYVDNKPYSPFKVASKYIYPGDLDLDVSTSSSATTTEANKLAQLCDNLSWTNPLSGALLTGWCVIAPVCGILQWRPHIWITGPSGSGKSTVLNMIVKKVVGSMVVALDGKTTEAGIRQRLKQDALPVVFDEAEAEDASANQRMQGVLDLARVASSGGRILKGTADGKGISFSIRSCFCFSSINTSVQHYADETRISRLVLRRDIASDADDKYRLLADEISNVITTEYSNKMLVRALENLHTLQANCATFVEAAARVLKSRRIADQVGHMLSGTYLCYSDKEISFTEAVKWIEKHDWKESTVFGDKADESRLVDRLLTYRLRVNTADGNYDTSLGELMLIVHNGYTENGISPSAAQRELKLNGLMVEDGYIYIATKCDPIRHILRNTPWMSEWARPLKDIPNAQSIATTYFCMGITSRAVALPIAMFFS